MEENKNIENEKIEREEKLLPRIQTAIKNYYLRVKLFFANKRVFNKKTAIIAAAIPVVAAAALLTYHFISGKPFRFSLFFGGPEYSQAYALVPDEISQSANIVLTLPSSIKKAAAQGHVVFEPQIAGTWVETDEKNELIFNPEDDLRLNRYYTVTLATEQGTIGKDFKSVENPKVVSVLPRPDSETNENSDITITFNRPMIPLTTLSEQDNMEVPVTIEPQTKGVFKWIGTRTLQFKPETTLIPSAHYKVSVNNGFSSLDSLPIEPMTHEFDTRPLRYVNIPTGTMVYSEPFRVVFNQPVDLDKMIPGITVEDTKDKKNVPFIAEYGYRDVYNFETKKYEKKQDESIIEIYNKEDQFGRSKLWDFEKGYYLNIQNAYPKGGNIFITQDRGTYREVTTAVKDIRATSERTQAAEPGFFDPQGTLHISFFEDIDLDRSSIEADNLERVEYGEKCKEGEIVYSTGCEKEPDHSVLVFTFKPDRIGFSQTIRVTLKKIINVQGQKINPQDYEYRLQSVPVLQILSSKPSTGSPGSDLTSYTICSNTPLVGPSSKDLAPNYISLSDQFEYQSWGHSYREGLSRTNYVCGQNQFVTRINYGLMPETNYTISLHLTDAFDSKQDIQKSFTTGKMPSHNLNFYHYQNSYTVTTPQKTKLTYAVLNMDYVNMHICELSAEDMLRTLENRPSYTTGPSTFTNCLRTVNERVELEKKYWIKNQFQIDLSAYVGTNTGHYVITFWHPDYKEQWGNGAIVYERSYVTMTNLSVVEKKVEIHNGAVTSKLSAKTTAELKNVYWVNDMTTLNPISNARVALYNRPNPNGGSIQLAIEGRTNSQGTLELGSADNEEGAVVSIASDSAIISEGSNEIKSGSTAYETQRFYLYTDRPIYRPSDEVHLKGLYRIGYDGDYELLNGEQVPVKIFDSRNQEVFNQTVTMNDYGTINASFFLDSGAPLGRYRIEAKNQYGYFDVEEYVPAAFKVGVSSDKEEYVSKDTMAIDVNAEYYFGVALEGGEVSYGLSAQDYNFDRYSDDWFYFGRQWYECYGGCSYGDQFVLRNTIPLNDDGTAHITQSVNLDELFSDDNALQSKILTLYVTVKNSAGESVSTQKSIIVHRGDHYLDVRPSQSYAGKNQQLEARLKSVNIQGTPENIHNVEVVLNKVDWVYNKRQEVDGEFYYNVQKNLVEINRWSADTNSDGYWSKEFKIEEAGEYELLARYTDNRGNVVTDTSRLYIYGDDHVLIRPTNDTSLDLYSPKTSLVSGEIGHVIITSPFEHAKALVSIERGQIFEYRIIDLQQNIYDYSFTAAQEYVPNVIASVTILSSDPEVKYGEVSFSIDTNIKNLNIKVDSNKDQYLPGEDVSLSFNTSNSDGKPVPAELSVAVVDMSVLALVGNPKKNPVPFFYGSMPHTVSTVSNIKNILHQIEIQEGGKGGGGAEQEDLESRKRGIFKDTAFWQAEVRTDADGRAQASFTLPDNLTTWQVETVGITKDTKLGVSYNEFVSRKSLMLQPLKPRFIVAGDSFLLGAKVFNQTNSSQRLEVSISSQTLELDKSTSKKITLSAGESQTVYFNAKAPSSMRSGTHVYTLFAGNDDFRDEVEQRIKITDNNTYEAVATSGSSKDSNISEYVYLPDNILEDKGELTINNSATLAVFLSDALNSMLAYPYGCSEQVASKLDTLAIIKHGLSIDNIGDAFTLGNVEFDGQEYTPDELVQVGLSRLYNTQKDDGSFGYYANTSGNIYLTVHVANVLKDLQDAGYIINTSSLSRANTFIKNYTDNYISDNLSILIAYTAYRIDPNHDAGDRVNSRINKIMGDDLVLKEKLSSESLVYLALLTSQKEGIFNSRNKNKVYDTLENRVDVDSRGAFLPVMDSNLMWRFYETPIKNTALLLKALVADKRQSEYMSNLMRWLLASRSKDGAWGSTNNTLAVVDAFTDFLKWSNETNASFSVSVSLNKKERDRFEYNAQNILAQNQTRIPIADLKKEELNTVSFTKTDNTESPSTLYYDIGLKYFFPIEKIAPRDEGFTIERAFYRLDDKAGEHPVTDATVGEVLRGELKIIVPRARNYVAVEDFIPAGVELVNFNLATEDKSLQSEYDDSQNRSWYEEYITKNRTLRPDVTEMRDDRLFLFSESLEEGQYTYTYFVRSLIPGTFSHMPAVVSEMYFPENFGRTGGEYFEVIQQ